MNENKTEEPMEGTPVFCGMNGGQECMVSTFDEVVKAELMLQTQKSARAMFDTSAEAQAMPPKKEPPCIDLQRAKYKLEFLEWFVKLARKMGADDIVLELKKDAPLRASFINSRTGKLTRFYIAPRIE